MSNRCMCKVCEDLEKSIDKLTNKDLGAFKMLLLVLHWAERDENFREILYATGFNPGRTWLDVVSIKGKEHGLVEDNKNDTAVEEK